ncbi:uncharacterized protein LOC112594269 [Melanaphis sacchari]|uniref:uncharacterized protein LOC112594269 n=1 Tax=Melanaphis sacchari TaxID=742174 RepID=UPI000DC13103|nr:uncharacterized protein LOC112594269 [Melanaphis sacchari]XP_025194865.1 uncharacterized protein LOC112594269 [Melanaphis sacchari]XP_025194947.1 uncharacterized protein LOC112594269 [Melanaphis sacchari]
MDTVTVHYWPTEAQGCLSVQPVTLFLTITLILSSCTTLMLCTSVWTNHWENMEWDFQEAISVLKTQNKSSEWYNNVNTEWLVNGNILKITINTAKPSPINNGDALLVLATANQYHQADLYDIHSLLQLTEERTTVILAPMYGGIWTLCISLTEDQLVQLYRETYNTMGLMLPKCVNYLAEESTEEDHFKPDWHHRMQNVSISCALVCIIIIVTASLIGLFSIFRHQISAMLITAVMYLLAATFGLFTLGIMHNKHHSRKTHSQNNCNQSLALIDGMINVNGNMCQTIHFWEQLLTARIYSLGWSVSLGWVAVILCILTSCLWIILSKIMRFTIK